LPLGHNAAEEALQMAAKRGAMKPLSGKLSEVRVARMRTQVGELDRTLVVVESQELLAGQKRGIAAALRKAKKELTTLQGLIEKGRIKRSRLELRIKKALAREHLASFVVTPVAGAQAAPSLQWHLDEALRRELERTRLGSGCCARTVTTGAPGASSTPSAGSGTSRSCSAERRKAAWFPARRTSGSTDRCGCIPSRRCPG
jgi:hypothetical protein